MNHEILFRGKHEGDWFYGDLLTGADTAQIWYEEEGYGKVNVLVALSTVGQYTGLTDRNGVKIFEGDIIQNAKGNDAYIVKCENIAFGCMLRDTEYFGFTDIYSLDYNDDNCLDVIIIGNLHDNPELLKRRRK